MSYNENQIDEAQFYSDLLRAFFDSANDAIFVLCDEMKFISCNKMTQEWLGYSEKELTQHNKRIPITELLGNPDSVDFYTSSFQQALNNEDVFFETLINPIHGKQRWVEMNMKRVDIESGDMIITIAIARDITQRKKELETIEYKTNYDHLTNLPNRNYLTKTILADKNLTKNKNSPLSILCIDINRFKEINKSLGKENGDRVLQEISLRLNRIVDYSTNESLVRIDGDEFILVLPDVELNQAIDIAGKIKHLIAAPLSIDKNKIKIDCNIGIANLPIHTQDIIKLLHYAESAMYTIKEKKQGIGVFDSSMHKLAIEKLQLISDLRDAIENDEIMAYYQPIINMNQPHDICIETLARWNHPSQGFISPEIFISYAEEVGIINKLTLNIITKSLTECVALLSTNVIQSISFNISPLCLCSTETINDIKKLCLVRKIHG
ncbi:MAG: diguanylate cyclase [gamma proteobacterium symbiont of Lucinoma myriamae]|nr:diguanylate cyclase [gamma proteobacterium symbiont of Lucinoma myriamae]MCU7833159.1 diguanylate cyclase [gamma proteobacterium symbiont of Lucinoma myriamae]